eukprot:359347-Chlamydomonas_euryale.AAC.4
MWSGHGRRMYIQHHGGGRARSSSLEEFSMAGVTEDEASPTDCAKDSHVFSKSFWRFSSLPCSLRARRRAQSYDAAVVHRHAGNGSWERPGAPAVLQHTARPTARETRSEWPTVPSYAARKRLRVVFR